MLSHVGAPRPAAGTSAICALHGARLDGRLAAGSIPGGTGAAQPLRRRSGRPPSSVSCGRSALVGQHICAGTGVRRAPSGRRGRRSSVCGPCSERCRCRHTDPGGQRATNSRLARLVELSTERPSRSTYPRPDRCRDAREPSGAVGVIAWAQRRRTRRWIRFTWRRSTFGKGRGDFPVADRDAAGSDATPVAARRR